jgi:phosphatidylglycerophosphate synthase
MKKIYNFTLADVEEVLRLKSWWAALAILPLARRLILFFANYTHITPNQITTVAFLIRIITCLLFLDGNRESLILGAFLFEVSYLLDCVDGAIARLKGTGSMIGAFFDHITDTFSISLNIIALAYGQHLFPSPVVLTVLYLYLFIHFKTFVFSTIWAQQKVLTYEKIQAPGFTPAPIEKKESTLIIWLHTIVRKYQVVFERNRFKAFLSAPDLEAFLLFAVPLTGLVEEGFQLAMYGFSLLFVYKIFSYLFVLKTASLNK